jgi:hypothetical protein
LRGAVDVESAVVAYGLGRAATEARLFSVELN